MAIRVMHVVSVAESLPVLVGDQIEYFSKMGVNFFLACTPSDELVRFAAVRNATPIPVEIRRDITIFKDIKSVWQLVRAIKKYNIDFVIGHTPKGSFIAMLAANICGVRQRIYVRHGLLFETSKGWRYYLFKNIERLTGLLSKKIVCVSESVLTLSKKEKLGGKEKLVLLNNGTFNGVDAIKRFNRQHISLEAIDFIKQKYQIDHDEFIYGFIGRLVNDKGLNELVAAWKRILSFKIKVKLVIIGRIDFRDKPSPAVLDYLHSEPSIILIGHISTSINLYYTLIDVLVLPSHREGLPTVVLEASAMEIPVITTKATGCIDSIIDGVTGLFCKLKPEDIVDKMLFYFNDRSMANFHGKNGRHFVIERFSPTNIWDEFGKKILKINDSFY